MKSLLLEQSKSRASGQGDGTGSSGTEEVAWDAWHVPSLHRETWLFPSLGSPVKTTWSRRSLERWGLPGDVAGGPPLLPPRADRCGPQNPHEGLQPLTKRGLNYLIKAPQLKRCRH